MRVQMNGVKTDGTPADMIVTLSGNLPIREGVGFNYEDHTADYTKVRPGEKRGSIINESKIFCVPNLCKVKFSQEFKLCNFHYHWNINFAISQWSMR